MQGDSGSAGPRGKSGKAGVPGKFLYSRSWFTLCLYERIHGFETIEENVFRTVNLIG